MGSWYCHRPTRVIVRDTATLKTSSGASHGEFSFLREGPRSQGASWAVCGSGVYIYILPYEFLNLYGVFDCRFSASFS
jgi:hypothetical protein